MVLSLRTMQIHVIPLLTELDQPTVIVYIEGNKVTEIQVWGTCIRPEDLVFFWQSVVPQWYSWAIPCALHLSGTAWKPWSGDIFLSLRVTGSSQKGQGTADFFQVWNPSYVSSHQACPNSHTYYLNISGGRRENWTASLTHFYSEDITYMKVCMTSEGIG